MQKFTHRLGPSRPTISTVFNKINVHRYKADTVDDHA